MRFDRDILLPPFSVLSLALCPSLYIKLVGKAVKLYPERQCSSYYSLRFSFTRLHSTRLLSKFFNFQADTALQRRSFYYTSWFT